MKRYRVTFAVDLEAADPQAAVQLAEIHFRNGLSGSDRVDCRELPPVERAALAGELRAHRERTGKSQEQAAEALEFSDSKMSRIESGEVSVVPRDVRDLLDFYGVDGPERERLIQTARELRGRS